MIIIGIFSISNSIAQKEDKENLTTEETLYFKIQMPDNWTYQAYSDTYVTQLLGFGPVNALQAVPSEFYDKEENFTVAGFRQDAYYTVKNVPLEAYVKDKIEQQTMMKVVSQNETILDNQTAIQIHAEGFGEMNGYKFLQYYAIHNSDPYFISYKAFKDQYEKYLPEFKKMLNTFEFLEN